MMIKLHMHISYVKYSYINELYIFRQCKQTELYPNTEHEY